MKSQQEQLFLIRLKLKKNLRKKQQNPEPVTESEAVEVVTETPRRSRRETVKPVKKKKSHLKAFFISLLIFLALISAGGYFGYQYVQSSLLPVDANSKEYVTVQIPEGSNVQEIGNSLENLVWSNMELSSACMLSTKITLISNQDTIT